MKTTTNQPTEDKGINFLNLINKKEATDYTAYQKYCKPKLAEMLNTLNLDYTYHKASGNYVYYNDNSGKETAVLDFVSGFGSNFLGHNNPTLKNVFKSCLDEDLPMNVQSSIRKNAHLLGKKINELHPSIANYFCHFTNSGAESVEAAFKHAYKVHLDIIRRKYEKITQQLHELYHHIENNHLEIELPSGVKELSKYRDDLDEYNLAQYEDFQNNPVICAFKGSYHGKTTSALKATFNKTFREGFEGMSAIQTVFIDLDKPERLKEAYHENKIEFLLPVLKGEKLELERITFTKLFAMILEVILGEGGVKPIPEKTLKHLVSIREKIKIPFILDEIQTGIGRTGELFSYTETALKEIEPEYILLSKALGGGITKIGVCMIHEKEYDLDFGFLHTSTFAEDEVSCKIAEKTLDIITENNGELLNIVKEKGHYLKGQLNELSLKYPNIIKEVRGKGLMIGIEFTHLDEYGPLFRYAGRQGFISLLIASYVLNYHNLRILAPITTLFKGNPGKKRESILRIQPSAYITKREIDQLIHALNECFQIIQSNNEYCLLSHLFKGDISETDRKDPKEMPIIYPEHEKQVDFDARIGFIVHITELKHLINYYLPALKDQNINNAKLVKWWNKLCRFLEPDVMHTTYIEQDGFVIEMNLVCVPYFPKYMIKTFSDAKSVSNTNIFAEKYLQEMQDKIMDAAIVSRDLGDERIPTSLVGLGAYTSIVTENGMSLNDYEIPVTTGNAYTCALMGQGIIEAAELNNIDLSTSKVAIMGAAGNIGSSLAALLTFYSEKLYLIGSDKEGSKQRIQYVINKCLYLILNEVKKQLDLKNEIENIELNGMAGNIYHELIKPLFNRKSSNIDLENKIIKALHSEEISENCGLLLNDLILKNNNNTNPYIEIASKETMKECDIVAIATNSSDAWLIGPNDVKKGAIVCCASTPSNLSETFKDNLDDYFVFDGGFAQLPEGNIIDFVGMPKDGMAYGCLSESLLLAFDGQNCSFSKGPLEISQVLKTIGLADLYDFKLGEFRLGDAIQRAYN